MTSQKLFISCVLCKLQYSLPLPCNIILTRTENGASTTTVNTNETIKDRVNTAKNSKA